MQRLVFKRSHMLPGAQRSPMAPLQGSPSSGRRLQVPLSHQSGDAQSPTCSGVVSPHGSPSFRNVNDWHTRTTESPLRY